MRFVHSRLKYKFSRLKIKRRVFIYKELPKLKNKSPLQKIIKIQVEINHVRSSTDEYSNERNKFSLEGKKNTRE